MTQSLPIPRKQTRKQLPTDKHTDGNPRVHTVFWLPNGQTHTHTHTHTHTQTLPSQQHTYARLIQINKQKKSIQLYFIDI